MKKYLYTAFAWGLILVVSGFLAYLFYFADCDVVKKYYYLTQTPGRCLP